MKAWVLKSPNELELKTKAIPTPGYSEVLVKIDAVAICATDLDVISYGPPALIEGEKPLIKILLQVMSIWALLLLWGLQWMSLKLVIG